MRLLGTTKKGVDKDKEDKIVPELESVEVILVHSNLQSWPKYFRQTVVFL